MERLKADNLRTLTTRKELEGEVIAVRSQLEGMHGAAGSLQEELEGVRRVCTCEWGVCLLVGGRGGACSLRA